jgi:AbrB family looped-hinge helix DNA binding protein
LSDTAFADGHADPVNYIFRRLHMVKPRLVRQLRNGQITIPKEFRKALGLDADDMLRVSLEGQRLVVEAVDAKPRVGSEWLKDLYDLFEPMRESLRGYSEQEINDAIDEAVEEVRTAHYNRRSANRRRKTA